MNTSNIECNKMVIFSAVLIALSFLSMNYKKSGDNEELLIDKKTSHKGYYESGELRYICYYKRTGTINRRTTARIEKFKFKRIYYDKCGNIKLIVTGNGESGCWRNKLIITKQELKNETIICDKEVFVYPNKADLEQEIEQGKLMF